MKRIQTLLSALILLTAFPVFSQSPEIKFGKVSAEDFEGGDLDAEAVILYDFGILEIIFNVQEGQWEHHFTRHTRIKINNSNGYHWADVELSEYRDGSSQRKVSSIKGYTYILDGKKVEDIKLDRKSIFEDKDNQYYTTKKFTLPEVKEGVIIEYTYKTISTMIYTLPSWQFQYDIPVVYSEYNIKIPEYLRYRRLASGFLTMSSEKSSGSDRIMVNPAETSSALNYTVYIEQFTMHDVPPFISEPYINSNKNYVSRLEFELETYKTLNGQITNYAESWESLNKGLLENSSFWLALDKVNFLKDDLELLKAENEDDEAYMLAINQMIKDKMQWNEFYSRYVDTSLRQAYNNGRGTTGDINLLLVAALREAGFQAYPLLLSTRNNGIVVEYFPLIKNFNYIIAYVENDGKKYFLDAVSKTEPVGYIPRECYNGKGLLVTDNGPRLIDIVPNESLVTSSKFLLKLDESAEITGDISMTATNYGAFGKRERYLKDGEEKYVEDFIESHDTWEIEEVSVKNVEDHSEPLIETISVESMEGVESAGNLLYINPLFSEQIDENPFKLENREYPVDFTIPFVDTYILSLELDSLYSVEEIPEPAVLALPNQMGMFRYSITQNGNIIQVYCSLNIAKAVFTSAEYPVLREFFSQIVAKEAEPIVLKRN